MRQVKKETDNRFLNLKVVRDDSLGVTAYQFAERIGVNSVAFIGYDKKTKKVLINNECTPPIGGFLKRAFGGSIDKDKSYTGIVIDEVKEEAGYVVSKDDVNFVGKAFVSTQMNQYCYLFMVYLDSSKVVSREPENKTEALSSPIWVEYDEVINGDDWKSIMILSKLSNSIFKAEWQ